MLLPARWLRAPTADPPPDARAAIELDTDARSESRSGRLYTMSADVEESLDGVGSDEGTETMTSSGLPAPKVNGLPRAGTELAELPRARTWSVRCVDDDVASTGVLEVDMVSSGGPSEPTVDETWREPVSSNRPCDDEVARSSGRAAIGWTPLVGGVVGGDADEGGRVGFVEWRCWCVVDLWCLRPADLGAPAAVLRCR